MLKRRVGLDILTPRGSVVLGLDLALCSEHITNQSGGRPEVMVLGLRRGPGEWERFYGRGWPRVLITSFMAAVRTGAKEGSILGRGDCVRWAVDCGLHRCNGVCFGTEVRKVGAFRRVDWLWVVQLWNG